jgi:hypothetical protein
MNILSEDERAALLRSLTDAPDEVLIDAVRQRKDWMKGIKSSFDEVRNFVGMKVTESSKPPLNSGRETGTGESSKKVDNDPEKVSHPTTRPNKSPGASSITKIGTKTKDDLIAVLRAGLQPNHDKFGEHLKLLWEREIVLYDGKEFYV